MKGVYPRFKGIKVEGEGRREELLMVQGAVDEWSIYLSIVKSISLHSERILEIQVESAHLKRGGRLRFF